MKQFMASRRIVRFAHPLYVLDFAPADLILLSHQKRALTRWPARLKNQIRFTLHMLHYTCNCYGGQCVKRGDIFVFRHSNPFHEDSPVDTKRGFWPQFSWTYAVVCESTLRTARILQDVSNTLLFLNTFIELFSHTL